MINANSFIINSHLFAILSTIKQQQANLETIERILRHHHPHITLQREGERLLADLRYYHMPISITFAYYEEIRGSKRIPRMDFELHLYDHFYLPSQQPDDT